MPSLPGFTDNPFQSRSDLVRAAVSILSALEPYKSTEKARIKLPIATAAGFDDTAAQLEGYARPLWAATFLLGEPTGDNLDLHSWVQGLQAGTNPESPEYWGDLGDSDQRMVEMESIAIALLSAPSHFVGSMDDLAKRNLVKWLSQINDHSMPQNNWLWFRVFVNLALVKTLDIPYHDMQDQIEADLQTLDTFFMGEGWSSDGLWGDERKQADYYSGSFAIQFAQLLYVRFAGEHDKTRAEEYRQRARDFGSTFWRYFDTDGAAIPFGRSLTYRFAFAAFWSAVACADVQLPAPLDNPGIVKGMLLRHLRWWSRQPDIFNLDGTMNIGFAYPNMYMSEGYNSPQSVYWCLKSLIVLALPETHAFWTTPELPHPLAASSTTGSLSPSIIRVVWPARQILCSTPEHHFLLSSGQMSRRSHKAREAKYGKFAYSSAFGFSVPSGGLLEQLAPDSTLCVSHDGGESWKMRSEPSAEEITDVQVLHGSTGEVLFTVPALVSVWRPWKYFDLQIKTYLIPLMERFPGWHVRVHRVRLPGSATPPFLDRVRLVDSGFALDAETSTGLFIPPVKSTSDAPMGYSTNQDSCWLKSRAGTSGIVDLAAGMEFASTEGITSKCFVLRPDPNTNLMASRTFIPSLEHHIDTSTTSSHDRDLLFTSGVFAVSASAGLSSATIHDMWLDRPLLQINMNGDDLRVKVVSISQSIK